MASTCNRFISRSSSSIKSAFRSNGPKSTFSRSATAPSPTRSPLTSHSTAPLRRFSFSRCPSELGCAQSLLPLHSVVAAARMTSCLSTTSRSCRAFSQGIAVTRLEIHGRLGMICHAILNDQSSSSNAVTSGHQYQMFDFCKKSIEDVKQFLTQYCIERNQAGYILIKDPLSIFYEAICVGLVWDDNLCNGDFIQPCSSNSGISL
ncbi:uncharacterized protein LOC111305431 [Durio zibethinus]|uniref:Uncharacterized protein LOC111305431 n=1 Tax=Durio zibethinus TaxID=66656 RepID=A0A6P6A1U5_DURZI|nr:uncharacterized protein LOC111305431 [Durio zibethinus]